MPPSFPRRLSPVAPPDTNSILRAALSRAFRQLAGESDRALTPRRAAAAALQSSRQVAQPHLTASWRASSGRPGRRRAGT
jgi:hypothetical protein